MPAKLDRCVAKVKAKQDGAVNPWAVCKASTGLAELLSYCDGPHERNVAREAYYAELKRGVGKEKALAHAELYLQSIKQLQTPRKTTPPESNGKLKQGMDGGLSLLPSKGGAISTPPMNARIPRQTTGLGAIPLP